MLKTKKKCLGLIGLSLLLMTGYAEDSASSSKKEIPPKSEKSSIDRITQNMSKGFYTILVLHKGESTDKLINALTPLAKEHGKSACITARVDDAELKPLFKELKLDSETAPTPLAIALAPNKIITGIFIQPPAKEAFQEALLPDQPLAIRKALKDGKIVIIKMQSPKTTGNAETDKGIKAFLSDKKNKDKYVSLPIDLDKAENKFFLKQLKIDPAKEKKSVVLGIAPPLKLVNKPFRGAATKNDIDKAVNPACGTGCAAGST